jgi:hypothetical protein
MSIWHSPTPILENQRGPCWLALLKNSVRISLAVGKRVSQFDGSIRVKHVTVQSHPLAPVSWQLYIKYIKLYFIGYQSSDHFGGGLESAFIPLDKSPFSTYYIDNGYIRL